MYLNFEYKTCRSSRPAWLLNYVWQVRFLYGEENVSEDVCAYRLEEMRNMLADTDVIRRKQRYCALACVHADVCDGVLSIKTLAGTPLLEIKYV